MSRFETNLKALSDKNPLHPKTELELALAQVWFEMGEASKARQLEAKYNMTIGWFYAEACRFMEDGKDIRQEELPAIVERLDKDLKGSK